MKPDSLSSSASASVFGLCLYLATLLTAHGAPAFPPPDGGWDCEYAGDIDPTTLGWDHDNGSDQWDATAPGQAGGSPGGAGVFAEGETDFLRIQDTGNPGSHGFADPGSNRKTFLTKDLVPLFSPGYNPLDQGVTLYFRARVPVPGELPLDNYHPAGGGATSTWPATGDGYGVHDGGKSTFGIRQLTGDMIVSFTLSTTHTGPGGDYTVGEGLAMNKLAGTTPTNDGVDHNDVPGTVNLLPLVVQDWHDVWITIEADTSGGGTHRADVYIDGNTTPNPFHVTAGQGDDRGTTYATMGLGATPQTGAIDIDFFNIKEGVHVPAEGGLFQITQIDFFGDEVSFSWPSREGQSFIVERSADAIFWEELDDSYPVAIGADDTTYTDDDIAAFPTLIYRVTRN